MRLIAILLLALFAAAGSHAGVVLIAVNQEDRVMLVDDGTLEVVGSVAVGVGPHEIAVSPDGKRAYVANSGKPQSPGRSITVIDIPARRAAATWDLGEHSPHDVAVSSDGKLLWVACAPTQAVLELDTASGKILRTYKTGREGGWMLTAAPDDRTVYVAHLEKGGITEIDRGRGQSRLIATAEGEMGFAVRPDGSALWAANVQESVVRTVAGGKVGATFSSGGKSPARVRFTPDGKRAVIPHREPNELTVLEAKRGEVAGRVPLAHAPKIVAVDAKGERAYVSHPAADSVSVVDLKAMKVVATIKTGKQPDGVAYAR